MSALDVTTVVGGSNGVLASYSATMPEAISGCAGVCTRTKSPSRAIGNRIAFVPPSPKITGPKLVQVPETRFVFDWGRYWMPDVVGQLILATLSLAAGRMLVVAGLPVPDPLPVPNATSSISIVAAWLVIAAPAK